MLRNIEKVHCKAKERCFDAHLTSCGSNPDKLCCKLFVVIEPVKIALGIHNWTALQRHTLVAQLDVFPVPAKPNQQPNVNCLIPLAVMGLFVITKCCETKGKLGAVFTTHYKISAMLDVILCSCVKS